MSSGFNHRVYMADAFDGPTPWESPANWRSVRRPVVSASVVGALFQTLLIVVASDVAPIALMLPGGVAVTGLFRLKLSLRRVIAVAMVAGAAAGLIWLVAVPLSMTRWVLVADALICAPIAVSAAQISTSWRPPAPVLDSPVA